ncbi:tail fiber domain-containing protein [Salmonella enterica]|nr:tail fiber domain-containing protein [Salmonella enterica]
MVAKFDDRTKRLDLPLPNADNFLQDDVARLIETINDLDGQVATLDAAGKLEQAQVPDMVPQLDASKKLADSVMPVRAVMLDATGKIPVDQLPNEGTTSTMGASSEQQMLALNATVGDICDRLDTGVYYILVDLPASTLGNWRMLPRTAVTSINGETGAVTGYAKLKPIAGAIAMALEGVNGPLRLLADGTDDYDAVTLKQLKTVQSSGAGGASMSGVMNNFIGAVEWFNGDRLNLPAGYIAADGQLESRTDPKTADLWIAVSKNMLQSIDDAKWSAGIAERGKYSLGDGSTTFRVPDLNGIQRNGVKGFTGIDSLAGLFLRGDGNSASNGPVGTIRDNAAPNIYGVLRHNYSDTAAIWDGGTGPFGIIPPDVGQLKSFGSQTDAVNGRRNSLLEFNAHNAHAAYGRDNAQEVRPNQVVGIWIIRANGNFQSSNTAFNVLNSDTKEPASGTLVKSGLMECAYKVAGATRHFINMQSYYTWGTGYVSGYLGVGMNNTQGIVTASNQFEFRSNGDFLANGGIYGVVLRSDQKMGAIAGKTGGSVQSRIVSSIDNSERSAFGMFTSVATDASETRFGNLALTADGRTTKTWQFGFDGQFRLTPGGGLVLSQNGKITQSTNGGTVDFFTGVYPSYLEIQFWGTNFNGAHSIQHAPSDVRKKTNIKTIPKGKALADMAMVRPVSFSFKANSLTENHPELPRSYGVIAQELEKVVPDAVITLSDGMKELDLSVVSGFLLATVKDLIAKTEAQDAQIAKLEAKLGS